MTIGKKYRFLTIPIEISMLAEIEELRGICTECRYNRSQLVRDMIKIGIAYLRKKHGKTYKE